MTSNLVFSYNIIEKTLNMRSNQKEKFVNSLCVIGPLCEKDFHLFLQFRASEGDKKYEDYTMEQQRKLYDITRKTLSRHAYIALLLLDLHETYTPDISESVDIIEHLKIISDYISTKNGHGNPKNITC